MDRALLFASRIARALRLYRYGHFTWKLAWLKAGSGSEFA